MTKTPTSNVGGYQYQSQPQPQSFQQPQYAPGEEDKPNVGLDIISFLFPLAGWILYFVYRDNSPIKAKACSKWAWIGFGATFFLYFIGAFAS